MKVLLIGSGGREDALAWKIAQSPLLTELYCAPGNAGISRRARCVDIAVDDIDGLLAFAGEQSIDLTVVGPERPLIAGLVDRFRAKGLTVYGPESRAARLEGSKAFTDDFLARHGLSHKQYAVFDDAAEAFEYARSMGAPIVVKADGEALGKGVKVCQSTDEAEDFIRRCMIDREFGPAGDRVVIEECLIGPECSIKVFTDGRTVLPMVPSQDHKRIGEGDTGDNTGGMGCYTPVPMVDDALAADIVNRLVAPTVKALESEDSPYCGTLYAGIILTQNGPELLEYNCRFGDPETQVVLPRLQSDLLEILLATAEGRLDQVQPSWSPQACICVVIASGGYPGAYKKGKVITGIEDAEKDDNVFVFHAGTAWDGDRLVTAGGRVLGVTALGDDLLQAQERAAEAIAKIHFDGMYYRRDIGWRAMEEK